MKSNRFECCFELPHKGIYFDVEKYNGVISFTMHNNSEVETEVCLRDDEIDRLISLLQELKSK